MPKRFNRAIQSGFEYKTLSDGTVVRVYRYGSLGKIREAEGTTVPSGVAGFAKGALFIKTNTADGSKALYENLGGATCNFNLIGDITASEINLAEGNLLVGNASGVATALDIGNTDGGVAIGNGTTATIAAMSGDVTMTNGGVTAIGADKVTKTMLASDVVGQGIIQETDGSLSHGVTVWNNTGGDLTAGTLVYLASYTGTSGITVVKADADGNIPATHVVLTTIANGAAGNVYERATVTGLNTNGRTIGDAVYLDATTAGGWTASAPTGADQVVQQVGTVKVVSATVGVIEFWPSIGDVKKIGTTYIQGSAVTAAKVALARGKAFVGNASGVASELDLPAGGAGAVVYTNGTDALVGTVQTHGANTSGSSTASITMGGDTASAGAVATASNTASITMGGDTASGTASISMGGSTASDGAVATASGTASISMGGNTASDGAVATTSGTASISMGGNTASDGAVATTSDGAVATTSGTASITMGGDTASAGAVATTSDGAVATASGTASITMGGDTASAGAVATTSDGAVATTSGTASISMGGDTASGGAVATTGGGAQSIKTVQPWAVFGAWAIDGDGVRTNGGGLVGTEAKLTNAGPTFAKVCDDNGGSPQFKNLASSSSMGGGGIYTADFQLFPDSEAIGDFVAFGNTVKFCEIGIDMSATVGVYANNACLWEYSKGSGVWGTLSGVFDNTDVTAQNGLRPFQQDGAVVFAQPADWATDTIDSQSGYWIRSRVTAVEITTAGITNLVEHDLISGNCSFVPPAVAGWSIENITVNNGNATIHGADVKFELWDSVSGNSRSCTWTANTRRQLIDITDFPVTSASNLFIIVTQEAGANEPNNVLIELTGLETTATHTHTGGAHTHGATGLTATDAGHTHTGGAHTHTGGAHTHGATGLTATDAGHTHTGGAHTHTGGAHTHGATGLTATDAGHTHTGGAHTHTGGAHTHGATGLTATDAGHTHTGGAHTHGATGLTATDAGHTHTGGAHTHGATGLTATDAGHTHASTGLTATDAGHTHTGGAHTHGATGLTATDAGHTHSTPQLTHTIS